MINKIPTWEILFKLSTYKSEGTDETTLNLLSFVYRVRIKTNDVFLDVSVCIKFFISIHGVTSRRIQTMRLASMGIVKPDGSTVTDLIN